MTLIRGVFITLMLVAPTAAVADGNSAFVGQEGSDNNLSIDQSAASNSLVRGLGDWSAQNLLPALAEPVDDRPAAFDAFFPSSVPGGDPLRQHGNNNDAHVTISGADGSALMMQLGYGNEGGIELQAEGARGMLLQAGTGNMGWVRVTADGAAGILEQSGTNNAMDLHVVSPDARAIVRVHGDNLHAVSPLTVNGSGGSVVDITVTAQSMGNGG